MATLKILIADDDPIIRLDLKQMLTSQGFEVIAEAGDGLEALRLAKELTPDLCVLDVKMPAMDGIEAAAAIEAESIAPVVLLTAYGDQELILRAKEAGVFAYLVKPFKPADLPPAIEVARSRFEQKQLLAKEVGSLKETLDSRKAIDRAKGILMASLGVTEPEAFRRIQQQSMNLRKSMKDVSEAIILASDVANS